MPVYPVADNPYSDLIFWLEQEEIFCTFIITYTCISDNEVIMMSSICTSLTMEKKITIKQLKPTEQESFSVSSRTNSSKLLTWWRPPIIDNPCVFYRNRCYAVKRRTDYWESDRKRRDDTLTVYLWTHLGVFIIVIRDYNHWLD